MTTETQTFWNPWRIGGWAVGAFLLLLPAIAMGLTAEIHWSVGDFLYVVLKVGFIGLGIELAVRASRNNHYRGAAIVALLTGFLVTTASGAVGIIGNEDHPANLMFFAVIALAIGGAFIARLTASGMARAMNASGVAQFAVPFLAIAVWSPPLTIDLAKTFVFNSGFAGLWFFSAFLFRKAAKIS